jgi:hypothetical protein
VFILSLTALALIGPQSGPVHPDRQNQGCVPVMDSAFVYRLPSTMKPGTLLQPLSQERPTAENNLAKSRPYKVCAKFIQAAYPL